MHPKLGGVPYGVGAPLVAGLAERADVAFVRARPTTLLAQLRRGELDAALVSSVEAICAPGYRVFAPLGIACTHEIRSVRAFAKRNHALRNIGLDVSSATSAALLRLLLAGPHAHRCAPELQFEAVEPTLLPDAMPHDLVLLIGDQGLNAQAGAREVWDLGREWVAWTKLPFVFAVWLLAPHADLDRIRGALLTARERGRELGPVDGTHGAAHYELDERDHAGLRRFWSACRAAQFAAHPDPEFVV